MSNGEVGKCSGCSRRRFWWRSGQGGSAVGAINEQRIVLVHNEYGKVGRSPDGSWDAKSGNQSSSRIRQAGTSRRTRHGRGEAETRWPKTTAIQ